jgi:hypothetical protein
MGECDNRTSADVPRRSFLQNASWGLAAAAALADRPWVHAAEGTTPFEIKIGRIGCGGRGTGALRDAIGAATKVIYPASGQAVEWDQSLRSTLRLGPERYELGPYPIPAVALPGVYRFS